MPRTGGTVNVAEVRIEVQSSPRGTPSPVVPSAMSSWALRAREAPPTADAASGQCGSPRPAAHPRENPFVDGGLLSRPECAFPCPFCWALRSLLPECTSALEFPDRSGKSAFSTEAPEHGHTVALFLDVASASCPVMVTGHVSWGPHRVGGRPALGRLVSGCRPSLLPVLSGRARSLTASPGH